MASTFTSQRQTLTVRRKWIWIKDRSTVWLVKDLTRNLSIHRVCKAACKIHGFLFRHNNITTRFSAPGAYSPEKIKLDAAPKYSFGLRTPLDKPNNTPGSLLYFLIVRLNKTNKLGCNLRVLRGVDCTFSFRHAAPGTYSPEKINLSKGPQYSLTGKGLDLKPSDVPGTFGYFFQIVHCDIQ